METISLPSGSPNGASAFPGLLGVRWFLASEAALFGGLFAGVVYLRMIAPQPAVAEDVWSPLLGASYTILLAFAAGSLWRAQKSPGKRGQVIGAGVSAASGLAFIALKMGDYVTHWRAGFRLDTDVFWASYYLCTGLHALHVAAGVLGSVAFVGLCSYWHREKARRWLLGLRAYWYFVDTVWLGLLLLFWPQ